MEAVKFISKINPKGILIPSRLLKNFKNPNVEIIIVESGSSIDETDYLLSSPRNKERMLKSIKNVHNKKSIREVEL